MIYLNNEKVITKALRENKIAYKWWVLFQFYLIIRHFNDVMMSTDENAFYKLHFSFQYI